MPHLFSPPFAGLLYALEVPHRVLGNPPDRWLAAALLAGFTLSFLLVLKRVALRFGPGLAARVYGPLRDCLAEIVAGTQAGLLTALALWAGSLCLDLPGEVPRVLARVAVVAFLVQAWFWGSRLIRCTLRNMLGDRLAPSTAAPVVGFLLRTALGLLVLLLALEGFGVNVSAILAGLGVGGIAVALAVQNILGDIFGSLSIALDKPFIVGDFIIVGDCIGTVRHIGLKSTQVQSLSGEQIILSNADLLKSRIRNFKRMSERRVVFGFGLAHTTPADRLEQVPVQIQAIIQAQPRTRFDRAHFLAFGDSALQFEVVYYVLDVDYNIYMDLQQAINLALLKTFRAGGISLAHPVRTVFQAAGGPVGPEPGT